MPHLSSSMLGVVCHKLCTVKCGSEIPCEQLVVVHRILQNSAKLGLNLQKF